MGVCGVAGEDVPRPAGGEVTRVRSSLTSGTYVGACEVFIKFAVGFRALISRPVSNGQLYAS